MGAMRYRNAFFFTATVTINSTITFSFSLTCAVASMAREER